MLMLKYSSYNKISFIYGLVRYPYQYVDSYWLVILQYFGTSLAKYYDNQKNTWLLRYLE